MVIILGILINLKFQFFSRNEHERKNARLVTPIIRFINQEFITRKNQFTQNRNANSLNYFSFCLFFSFLFCFHCNHFVYMFVSFSLCLVLKKIISQTHIYTHTFDKRIPFSFRPYIIFPFFCSISMFMINKYLIFWKNK